MRAVIYARFSSERQRQESIEDQIAVCTRYAEDQGIEVVGTYTDSAKTGRSDKRPGFQQMIADSAKREWDTVLVYKLDRFSRDRLDSLLYRRDLEKNGVKVKSVMEAIPEGDDGILLDSLLTAMAEHYSRSLSTNVRRGLSGNAKRHHWNGVKVYGYRHDEEGHYQIYEPEAEHVRELFHMALECEVADLIHYCRVHDIRTGQSNPADYQWIRHTLGNPKYKGTYTFGDFSEDDAMPAIVSPELWEQVQRARRIRPKSKRKKHDYPLVGKTYCSCGKRMRGVSAKSGKYLYYDCPCGRRIRKEVLEDIVSASTISLLNTEAIEGIVNEIEAFSDENDGRERADRIEREIRGYEKRNRNIMDSIEGGFDAKDLQERYERNNARIAELQAELEEIALERPPHEILLQACTAFLIAGDLKDKSDIFIQTVLVDENEVIIQFNASNDIEIIPNDIEKVQNSSDKISMAGTVTIYKNSIVVRVPWSKSINRYVRYHASPYGSSPDGRPLHRFSPQ